MKTSVYFLSAPGRIKVGISKNVPRRLAAIRKQVGRVHLIGYVPGDYGFERHLHTILAPHRIESEWFTECDAVRSVVDRVLLDGDLLGFSPLEKPVPQPTEQTPEEWLEMFNKFVGMVWSGDPAAGFADHFEIPIETASAYLTGRETVPQIVASAFAAKFVEWMLQKHMAETA
jgi:hypothetical protein